MSPRTRWLIGALVVAGAATAAVLLSTGGGPEVRPVPEAEPSPAPEGSLSPTVAEGLGADQLVLVIASTGAEPGVYAMYGDGHTEAVASIDDPHRYLNPGFVRPVYQDAGKAIVVERRDVEVFRSKLVYLDLETGDEVPLVEGYYPSVGSPLKPGLRIAYFRMFREEPQLVIADIATDYVNELDLDAGAEQVAWDRDTRFVYVLTGEEAPRLLSYDSTGELEFIEIHSKNETSFIGVTSDAFDSAVVLQACCSAGEIEGAALSDWELGEIRGGSTGEPKYRSLVDLNELGLTSEGLRVEDVRLTAAGALHAAVDAGGTISWSVGGARSWILGFKDRSWLIDESGEIVELEGFATGGVAVAPKLLR